MRIMISTEDWLKLEWFPRAMVVVQVAAAIAYLAAIPVVTAREGPSVLNTVVLLTGALFHWGLAKGVMWLYKARPEKPTE